MTKAVRDLAKALCDQERRRRPHLKFFLGDGPCAACLMQAKARIAALAAGPAALEYRSCDCCEVVLAAQEATMKEGT